MSRQVNSDFNEFLLYIEKYQLSTLTKNDRFVKCISEVHKKYYSYLVMIAEASNNRPKSLSDDQFSYLIESCSDVGNSLFMMINGSYKGANLILRSSIENFLKALFATLVPGIIIDKSMFHIIDTVKNTSVYKDADMKPLLDDIFTVYKELCADVHTATVANMEHVTALKHFPMYDEAKAKKSSDYLTKVVSRYITLICMLNKEYIAKIHFSNKAVIFSTILRRYRPIIQGIS